jgi:nicotinate-nucleotide pyrophosphorylase (carboxylating)
MRQGKVKKGRIEVEAQSIDEVREAVKAKADVIMLDNFTPEMAMRARRMIPPGIAVEISGGVNVSNVADYAPHADLISMGALTHSYRSVDVSLEIEEVLRPAKRRSSRSP